MIKDQNDDSESGLPYSGYLIGRALAAAVCVGALCCTSSEAPHVDPGLVARTHVALDQHRSTVKFTHIRDGCVPADFLDHNKNLEGVDPADYWGRRFRLVEEPAGLRVISAGRDGEIGTEDDLLSDIVEAELCQGKIQDEGSPSEPRAR